MNEIRVLFRLKQLVIVSLFSILPFCFTDLHSQNNGFVQLVGKDFYLNGEPFYPIVMNYGVSVIKHPTTGVFSVGPATNTIPNDGSTPYPYCYNVNDGFCYQTLVKDLERVKRNGFNTIRLVGSLTMSEKCDYSDNTCAPCCKGDNPGDVNGKRYNNYLSMLYQDQWNWKDIYPVIDDSTRGVVFNLIEIVLQAATEADLKVILLVGGVNTDHDRRIGYDENTKGDYITYLEQISYRFRNHPTLFAYDMYNEPGRLGLTNKIIDENNFVLTDSILDYSKRKICEITSKWYNAIKHNTTNQYVTIGLFDRSDLGHWDPFVVKVDFLSLHLYGYSYRDSTNSQLIGEKIVKSHLLWAKNHFDKPWIIGETGFSSSNGACLDDYGDYNQQLDFATFSLEFTRDCGGSGYSWWIYKDIFYNQPVDSCRGSYFGLFTKGYTPINETDCPSDSSCSKPATSAFKNFDPYIVHTSNCILSEEDYYNPRGYPTSDSTGRSGIIRRISDSLPVSVAHITGWHIIGDNWYPYSTFTKPDGTFDLKSDKRINALKVGAKYAKTSPIYYYPHIPDVIYIDQPDINHVYDFTLDNITYGLNEKNYFEAYNDIFVSNTILTGNGSTGSMLTLKAGNIIYLNEGFNAQPGSYFLAYFGQINIDNCDLLPDTICIYKDQAYNSPLLIENPIKDFYKEFVILPNPARNTIVLKLSGNSDNVSNLESISVSILTIRGNVIHRTEKYMPGNSIDISTLPNGVYFAKIESQDIVSLLKFIKTNE